MKHYKNNQLLIGIAEVATKLRGAKSSKLSQEDVMNDIKINTGISIHIGRIETAVNNITISNLSLLCDYYGVSLSKFFSLVENEMKKEES